MPVPANTLQTYQSNNNAENVTEIVMNVDPIDTPAISMMGESEAEATYTQWPIETLSAVDTANANIEGDDATIDPSATPVLVGNWCQLMDKTASVTTTQEKIKKYGVTREMAKQLTKKGRELRRDMESQVFANSARVVGAAGTAQRMRPLPSWITTNTSRGATGANGSVSTAATDGTQRNFTEALLRTLVVTTITNADELPGYLFAGPANRANVSTQLSGNSTRFYEVKDGTLNASLSVYRTDYGPLKIVMNRFQRERDMFLLNMRYLKRRVLEPMQTQDLAVTGLTKKKQMWTNWTLEVCNEKAHAVLADLNIAVL